MNSKLNSLLRKQIRVSKPMRAALSLLILVAAFQNCSPGFTVAELGNSSLGTNADGTPLEPQTPPTAKLGMTVTNVSAKQASDLVFRITLGMAQTQDVAVEISTLDGTAVSGVDYLAVTPAQTFGKLVIPAGMITATFTVPSLSASSISAAKDLSVKVTATMAKVVESVTAKGVLTAAFIAPKFKKISAGWYFACGITMTDTVQCWGEDYSGGYGIDPKEGAGLVDVAGLAGVKDIQSGESHVCVITATDTVKCWGGASLNGDGTTTASTTPVAVSGLTSVKMLSTKGSHTCALDAAGKIKCWGSNYYGQLGDGTVKDALVPVEVPGVVGAKSVSAGYENTCLIAADDSVKCWGSNEYGQIGNGTADSQIQTLTPTTVTGLSAKLIAVGDVKACAIAMSGEVVCWGYSGYVDGQPTSSSTPVAIAGVSNAKDISDNLSTTCALTVQNTTICWGANLSVFTQTSAMPPTLLALVPAGLTTNSISVGVEFACAVASDNTVRCIGRVPKADFQNFSSTQPWDAPGVQGFKQIDSSSHVSCGVTAQDTVRCWLENTNGVFGASTPTYSGVPVLVNGLTGIKKVAVGYSHACALSLDGKVKCWGNNSSGQIGNGVVDPNPVLVPFDVGLAGVKDIAANSRQVCAITATDTVTCWGGQDASGVTMLTPQPVPGLIAIKSISLGEWGHACAVTATNTVKCWGQNGFGQAGQDPTATPYLNAPADVAGLTDVTSLTLSNYSSCARLATGKVKCWGYDASGELGNGTGPNSFAPTEVAGLATVSQLSGASQICAVLANGTLKCWGYSFDYVLHATPTDVPFNSKVAMVWPSYNSLAVNDEFGRVRIIGKMGALSVLPTLLLAPVPATSP